MTGNGGVQNQQWRENAAFWFFLDRNRNVLLTCLVFAVVFAATNLATSGSYSYFDFASNLGTGATLALGAAGLTVVILVGGVDVSGGAVISLVNVLVGTLLTDDPLNQVIVSIGAIVVGGLAGSINGGLVAYLRMQPVVVTLATLFIFQGAALLILPIPGGHVPSAFSDRLAGDLIPGALPSVAVILLVALAVWSTVKNSRLGAAIYAIGSDEAAALASGVKTRRAKFFAYTIAGSYYGAAGLFVSAQSGGSDPLVGSSMLIQLFAAVVLGGTPLTGGRGGVVGSVLGAYLLMSFVNSLMVFSLPTYLAPIFDGTVLVLAVVVSSLASENSLVSSMSEISRELAGRISSRGNGRERAMEVPKIQLAKVSWLLRHRADVMQGVPALCTFALIAAITAAYTGTMGSDYFRAMFILSTFLGVVAFGQTVVIITGGLDLSVPWAITLSAMILTGLANGNDLALLWSVPIVMGVGAMIGLANGLGVSVLKLSPIVITLATNGILQGFTLFYTGGSPSGLAPPLLRSFVSGHLLGLQPAVWAFALFTVVATLSLAYSSFGRRLYAVGNSPHVAYLSGINVRATIVGAYVISGIAASIAGMLVAGFNGAATLSMGDSYLLPSIAVVVAGGVLITGGRGHFVGVVCGVLMLIALQILIGGTQLPDAVRGIILGLVLLGSLFALQIRKPY